jgi:hypothetical protein
LGAAEVMHLARRRGPCDSHTGDDLAIARKASHHICSSRSAQEVVDYYFSFLFGLLELIGEIDPSSLKTEFDGNTLVKQQWMLNSGSVDGLASSMAGCSSTMNVLLALSIHNKKQNSK